MSDSIADVSFARLLRNQRVVAIIREETLEDAVALGERFLASGIHLIEVSLVTPGAVDAIAALTERAQEFPGVRIGGGTVLMTQDVARVRRAGGSFVLSPVYDLGVVEAALGDGLAVVPGCATPSEMVDATNRGAEVVKIFPASNWTPRSVKDLLQALPDLALLPTGGVAEDNVVDWLNAGAIGVGLGGMMKAMDDSVIRRFLAGLPRLEDGDWERTAPQ